MALSDFIAERDFDALLRHYKKHREMYWDLYSDLDKSEYSRKTLAKYTRTLERALTNLGVHVPKFEMPKEK